MIDFSKIVFDKESGLIPCVVQDTQTGRVLMLAMMNEESLKLTLETKKLIFWSRSRKRIWIKGETSGNFLNLVSLRVDCDGDALLAEAEPQGPTCHKGTVSCFDEATLYEKSDSILDSFSVLGKLEKIIQNQSKTDPSQSYTAKLFSEGAARIGQKVGEEGVEVAIAAQYSDSLKIAEESADLLYHLLVLCRFKELEFSRVLQVLRDRMKS